MNNIIEPPPKYNYNYNIEYKQTELTIFDTQFIINKSLEILKPICFFFYNESIKGNIKLIYDDDYENDYENGIIIYLDDESFSSNILNIYKLHSIYVCVTENTIYVLSINIDTSEL